MTDIDYEKTFGFNPTSIGNRYRHHHLIDKPDYEDEQAGAKEGYLCVRARDGASNPIDPDACKHPNFVGTGEDDFDRTYRYYYYRPLTDADRVDPAALSAAQEEVARYKRKLMQGEAILAGWTRIDRIKLAAGEMTAQEARTALAVAKGIAASVRSAIAALAVMECGGEAKGACPACGCEEANSRNLWTCECPAPRPEAVGEDGG